MNPNLLMPMVRQGLFRSGLEAFYLTGAYKLFNSMLSDVGVILMLHRVKPPCHDTFQPNRWLEITPQFLGKLVDTLRQQDFELISMDEMHQRLVAQDFRGRFACLTFDDAYRDNFEWAYPILKRERVPFAIYVPSSFLDRTGHPWWVTLEHIIAGSDEIDCCLAGGVRRLKCRTASEKYAAARVIHRLPSEERDATLFALCEKHEIDVGALCDSTFMTWQQLQTMAEDPLVILGAHTVSHINLRDAPESAARHEMAESAARIEAILGFRPVHFAYPYGDRKSAGRREFMLAHELGFKTAVTSREGVLFWEHRDHFMALPRIKVDGKLQHQRFLKVLISGAPMLVRNGFQRIDIN